MRWSKRVLKSWKLPHGLLADKFQSRRLPRLMSQAAVAGFYAGATFFLYHQAFAIDLSNPLFLLILIGCTIISLPLLLWDLLHLTALILAIPLDGLLRLLPSASR